MPHKSKRKFFYHGGNFKIFAVIFLSIATIALFSTEQRYTTHETQILANLDFSQSGRHWNGTSGGIRLVPGEPATVILENEGRRQTLMTQKLRRPHRFTHIRISAEAKIDGVKGGKAWWQKAGVIVLSYDRQGKRLGHWPSEIAFLAGTHPWQHYQTVIPINEAIGSLQLFLLHGGESGSLHVRNLRVDSVQEATWFAWLETILLGAWLAIGLWILLPLLLLYRRAPLALLALASCTGLLAVSVLPQPLLSTSSKPALDKIAVLTAPIVERVTTSDGSVRRAQPDRSDAADRKDRTTPKYDAPTQRPVTRLKSDYEQYLAHFASHVLSALLVGLAFWSTGWRRLSVYLLAAAAINELLQLFVITRSAGLADGVANLAGVVAGLLIVSALLALRNRLAA